MQTIGLVAGLATFLSVWFGHVAVRKIEFVSPALWLPVTLSAVLGLGLEIGALLSRGNALSAALGILGITLLFDALEFARQQNRVKNGHAPANPRNPRHFRILAEFPTATAINPLKHAAARRSRPDTAVQLVEEQRQ